MDPQQLVALMASGGGGAILLATVTGVFKWLSGASARERIKNTDIISQRQNAIKARDEAEDERDSADVKRRQAEENVSLLRRQLIDNGHIPVVPIQVPEEKKEEL